MRFFVLVAAAATIGAGSVVAIKTIFPQQSASVAAAARSLGAEAARFRLSSLNPIRSAYDEVKAKITSPDPNPLGFSSTPLIVADHREPDSCSYDQLERWTRSTLSAALLASPERQ